MRCELAMFDKILKKHNSTQAQGCVSFLIRLKKKLEEFFSFHEHLFIIILVEFYQPTMNHAAVSPNEIVWLSDSDSVRPFLTDESQTQPTNSAKTILIK